VAPKLHLSLSPPPLPCVHASYVCGARPEQLSLSYRPSHPLVLKSYMSILAPSPCPPSLTSSTMTTHTHMPQIAQALSADATGPRLLNHRTSTTHLLCMSCRTHTSFQGLAPRPLPLVDSLVTVHRIAHLVRSLLSILFPSFCLNSPTLNFLLPYTACSPCL
jgi:hypothetical protein